MIVEYFNSTSDSNRYKSGQKVWIRLNCANHLMTFHKWRGSGRYVEGFIDKSSSLVGEIKSIKVDDSFAKRIKGL